MPDDLNVTLPPLPDPWTHRRSLWRLVRRLLAQEARPPEDEDQAAPETRTGLP